MREDEWLEEGCRTSRQHLAEYKGAESLSVARPRVVVLVATGRFEW